MWTLVSFSLTLCSLVKFREESKGMKRKVKEMIVNERKWKVSCMFLSVIEMKMKVRNIMYSVFFCCKEKKVVYNNTLRR